MMLPQHVTGIAHALGLPWALAWLPLGFGWGYAHLAALRQGIACLVSGRPGVLGLLLVRLVLAGTTLSLTAHRGAAPLLALFIGFLLAKHLGVRAAQRRSVIAEGLG